MRISLWMMGALGGGAAIGIVAINLGPVDAGSTPPPFFAAPPPTSNVARVSSPLTTGTGAPTVVAPSTPPRTFAIDVFAFAPWGDAIESLGHTRPSEGSSDGPMAIAVDDAQDVFVLDQVNARIVERDSAGFVIRTIPLGSHSAQDLAVDPRGGVVVLDRLVDRSVRFLGLDGVERARVALEGQGIAEGGAATGVFAMRDGVWIEVEHRALVRVALPSGDVDPLRPTIDGRRTDAGLLLRAARDPSGGALVSGTPENPAVNGFYVRVPFCEPVLQLLALDGDRGGTTFVAAHLLRDESTEPFSILAEAIDVVALGNDGGELGRFSLPPPEGPEETRRPIAVASNGDVFHMHFGDAGVTIRRAR